MSKRKIALVIVFILGLISIFVCSRRISKNSEGTSSPGQHKVTYYDEQSFIEGVSRAETSAKNVPYSISGGIVPHHLLAGYIIADFFKKLAIQKPSTIIFLGPNHEERGNFKVITSMYDWDTPYGVIHADANRVNTLVEKNLARADEKVLPEDQAVSALLPFIAFYSPQTKIVPLLIKKSLNQEDVDALAKEISKMAGEKGIVIVASVDFSHYLSLPQANAKDEESIAVIKDFDCKKILAFTSDNVDSPGAVCTLLSVMQKLKKTNLDVLYHENSTATSYFSIFFH